MEKEKLEIVVKDSLTLSEVCKKMNLRVAGGNINTIKKYIERYNINCEHFTGQAWNTGERFIYNGKRISLQDILDGKYPNYNTNHLKNRLIKEGLKENKCEICGIEEWQGKELSCHLDHIDGNSSNHKLDNLRMLCPNCHSQTETYCSKIKKKDKYSDERFIEIFNESKNYREIKIKLGLSKNGTNIHIKNTMKKLNLNF